MQGSELQKYCSASDSGGIHTPEATVPVSHLRAPNRNDRSGIAIATQQRDAVFDSDILRVIGRFANQQ